MRNVIAIASLILLTGCGKNYSGTFKGTAKTYVTDSSGHISTETSTITVTLKQDGDAVVGDWSSTTGASGSVAGKAGATIHPITITDTTGCKGAFEGEAFFDPDIPGDKSLGGMVETKSEACGGKVQTFLTLIRQ